MIGLLQRSCLSVLVLALVTGCGNVVESVEITPGGFQTNSAAATRNECTSRGIDPAELEKYAYDFSVAPVFSVPGTDRWKFSDPGAHPAFEIRGATTPTDYQLLVPTAQGIVDNAGPTFSATNEQKHLRWRSEYSGQSEADDGSICTLSFAQELRVWQLSETDLSGEYSYSVDRCDTTCIYSQFITAVKEP